MISKSDLRKKILEERKQLNIKELSHEICKNIKKNIEYNTAKNIFAYYPMKYEVDITELFLDTSKNWYLPKTNNQKMDFYLYKNGDELKKSNFGVLEPTSTNNTIIIPDLIIVPALCADKNSYRLGYGKGFYDRFLAQNQYHNICTITPVFSKFILDNINFEKHDIKIDIVISEK